MQEIKIHNHHWKVRENTNDIDIINENFVYGFYNLDLIEGDVKTFIDIGAHIGSFTVKLKKKYPDAKGKIYEPMQENYKLLKFNIKNIDGVESYNTTVSGDRLPGKLKRKHDFNTGENLFDYTSDCEYPNTHINDIVTDEVDVLKLDCEGGENSIFENLDFSKVKYIFCELHSCGSIIGNDATVAMIKEKGFKLLHYKKVDEYLSEFVAKKVNT